MFDTLSDDDVISFCVNHGAIPGAVFSAAHISRLLRLDGQEQLAAKWQKSHDSLPSLNLQSVVGHVRARLMLIKQFQVVVVPADEAFWEPIDGEQFWTFDTTGGAPEYRDAFSHAVLLRPLRITAHYEVTSVIQSVYAALRSRFGQVQPVEGVFNWEVGQVREREDEDYPSQVVLVHDTEVAEWVSQCVHASIRSNVMDHKLF